MRTYLFPLVVLTFGIISGCAENPFDDRTSRVAVTGVTVAETLDIEKGGEETLAVTIIPFGATDRGVTWSSDDATRAVLKIEPSTGKITAVGRGKATVTVTTADGGFTDECVVTVLPEQEEGMVFVGGGTFMMGSNYSSPLTTELPIHQVTLGEYYIGKYEVTQKQWKEVMGVNPSLFPGDDRPVEKVSWEDVHEFIAKLNLSTGKNYRLPTEAEWEYAARGGHLSKGYLYSGSNNIAEVGWYSENSKIDGRGQHHPVGLKLPNELGIYDMTGNVEEWCSDYWYKSYPSEPQTDPAGPAGPSNTWSSDRVVRGGAWSAIPPLYGRSASRTAKNQTARLGTHGFRLVLVK